jgi:hypothetical protein
MASQLTAEDIGRIRLEVDTLLVCSRWVCEFVVWNASQHCWSVRVLQVRPQRIESVLLHAANAAEVAALLGALV